MALKWVEGFESYSNLVNFLQFRYPIFNVPSASFQPGRAIGNALQVNGTQFVTPTFSNAGGWIVGFAFKNVNLGTSNINMPLVDIRDGTTAQLTLWFNPFTKLFGAMRGATVVSTGTFAITTGAWYYIEIKGNIDSAVGLAEIHVNTTVDSTFVGNTQVTVNGYANNIGFRGPAAVGIGGSYQIDDFYINDGTTAVNNDFLGDMKIEPVNVVKAGFHTDWGVNVALTPNFECVQVLNDGLYTQSNTPGEDDSFECSSLYKITGSIAGVSCNYWARNTDSTTHAIKSLIRIAGVDYLSAATTINDTAFKEFSIIWPENPATVAPWLVAGINGAEFGVDLFS
jgi:hypothetical protein